jgi:hypothetical protein
MCTDDVTWDNSAYFEVATLLGFPLPSCRVLSLITGCLPKIVSFAWWEHSKCILIHSVSTGSMLAHTSWAVFTILIWVTVYSLLVTDLHYTIIFLASGCHHIVVYSERLGSLLWWGMTFLIQCTFMCHGKGWEVVLTGDCYAPWCNLYHTLKYVSMLWIWVCWNALQCSMYVCVFPRTTMWYVRTLQCTTMQHVFYNVRRCNSKFNHAELVNASWWPQFRAVE